MPNIHTTLSSLFSDIADAIRAKTGGSAQIIAHNFPTEIANIPTGVDTSDAMAGEGDILATKTAYLSDGTKHTGSMTNRGAVSQTLDTTTTSYTIPSGYHNGNGSVSVTTQTKSVTPSTSSQTVSADSGKVLEKVNVGAISTQSKSCTPSGSAQTITPDSGKYFSQVSVGAVTKNSGIGQTLYNQGVSDTKVGTAGTGDVLSGKTFTNNTTVGASGGMTNRGAWTASVTPSASAQTVTIPQGYHNGSGYVSVGASSGGVINTLVEVATTTWTEGSGFLEKRYRGAKNLNPNGLYFAIGNALAGGSAVTFAKGTYDSTMDYHTTQPYWAFVHADSSGEIAFSAGNYYPSFQVYKFE